MSVRENIAVSIAVVGAISVGLTGCTALVPAGGRSSLPLASPSASSPSPVVTAQDGVVATGALITPAGQQAGSVVITRDGAKFVANLVNFSTDVPGQKSVSFSPEVLAPADCVSNRYVFSWADGDTLPNNAMDVGLLRDSGDPSYLRSVVVNRYPIDSQFVSQSTADCYEPTIASAVLTWTLPDMRPGLGSVIDGGRRTAAQGTVTFHDGKPVSYATVAGDTLIAIAQRLGVTTDDLVYLNPRRPSAYKADTAYAEEVLNLERSAR